MDTKLFIDCPHFFPPTFFSRLLTDLHQIWHDRASQSSTCTEARLFG